MKRPDQCMIDECHSDIWMYLEYLESKNTELNKAVHVIKNDMYAMDRLLNRFHEKLKNF